MGMGKNFPISPWTRIAWWVVRPGADTDSMFIRATAFELPANAPWYT